MSETANQQKHLLKQVLFVLQECIPSGNTKQLQLCHCEEGVSGAPDVAISRYCVSKLLFFSTDSTGRLPRCFAPRNDILIAALHYKNVYLFINAAQQVVGEGLDPPEILPDSRAVSRKQNRAKI